MTAEMEQFQQVFFEESLEGLGVMENGLARLDPGSVERTQLDAMFRAAHSMKGGGGIFGFPELSDFARLMEAMLNEMRDGRRPITLRDSGVLLRSVGVLRDMLQAASDGVRPDQARVGWQRHELEQALNTVPGVCVPDSNAEAAADIGTQTAVRQSPPPGWHIVFRPHPHFPRSGNDPLRIMQELWGLAALEVDADTSDLPPLRRYQPETCYLSWELYLRGPADRAAVDEVFEWVEGDCDLLVLPLPAPAGAAEKALKGQVRMNLPERYDEGPSVPPEPTPGPTVGRPDSSRPVPEYRSGTDSGEAAKGLKLADTLVIQNAADWCARFAHALLRGGALNLDAGGLKRIDGAGIQLLCVVVRDAVAQGLEVNWLNVPHRLHRAARMMGLVNVLGLGDRVPQPEDIGLTLHD